MSESKFELSLDTRLCKSCGICAAICPNEVLQKNAKGMPEFASPEACIGCLSCEIHCPDFAIRIGRKEA